MTFRETFELLRNLGPLTVGPHKTEAELVVHPNPTTELITVDLVIPRCTRHNTVAVIDVATHTAVIHATAVLDNLEMNLEARNFRTQRRPED